jgi:hypothetical protein
VAIGKYVGIGIAVNHQFLYFLNQLIQKKIVLLLIFEFWIQMDPELYGW